MFDFLKSNEVIWLLYVLINYSVILFAYRKWGKVGLMIFAPISIILANVQVNKLVYLFGIETTLGNIAYSSIFLISDILSENYGKKAASKVVGIGFLTMIFTTVVMNIALILAPSTNDTSQVHLAAIFTPFIRFTVASLLAYVISSNVDINLYQIIKKIYPDFNNIWIRNNLSTLLSQVLDNLIFNFVAFYGVFPISLILTITFSTYFLKIITSALDTPFVYIATYWKNKGVIEEI
ncbi:queuosine precursor transporter [Streptobacillus notomytis]|uniref:queuosine precursor transporter n=1 Tax=Streptobacillus notomytis TaxID=1712031 RepID=UPI000836D62C|nr:queuosine precursor transporter [Streptobacillus notomytis]